MCNIWLRSDGRVESKGGYRHTDSWYEWLPDNFYGGSATKLIVIKEPSLGETGLVVRGVGCYSGILCKTIILMAKSQTAVIY